MSRSESRTALQLEVEGYFFTQIPFLIHRRLDDFTHLYRGAISVLGARKRMLCR